MPSTGAALGDARRAEPRRAPGARSSSIAERAEPTPGQHGEVGARDVVDELGAEPAHRDLDRADVPGAVVADGDLHSFPFVDGIPARLDPQRGLAARARLPCTRPRRCGGRRGRTPRRGSPSAPACARLPKKCAGHPRLGLDRELGERAPAEVDGGSRERVVHRHDRVAVAGDPAAVAERAGRAPRRTRAPCPRRCGGRPSRGRRRPRRRGRGRRGRRAARGSGRRCRRRSGRSRGSRRRGRAAPRSASPRSRAGGGRRGRRPRRPAPAGRAGGASASTSRSSSTRSRIVIRMPSS